MLLALLMAVCVAGNSEAKSDSERNNEDPAKSRITHLSLEELGNIEVTTVSKEPEKVNRTPAAVYVITQEDIRRSGATSLPEILRLVPGVEVARIDSNQWSLGIRGFGSSISRSVLVLIDGRSVYTPLFAGVWWNVQDTLLEDIERIEVIRGPGGTIWGANAVNGVINIVTKNARDTHGTLLTLGGGNVDQGTVGFRYGGGNDKGFNYRVYGRGFTRGPEFHPDHQGFDDWRMGQVGFRTDARLNDHDTLTVQGDLYNGDAGQNLSISTDTTPFLSLVQQNAELGGGNVVGRWRRVLGEGSDVELEAYYDRTNRHQANFGEDRDTFDVDFIHHLTLPARQDFLWGLGARLSSGNATTVVPTVVFTPNRMTDARYSAFVQDEIPLERDRLSVTVGTKLLHNVYSGIEVEPGARLLWTPNRRQTVWAAVTRAVRTPSRLDEDLQLSAVVAVSPLIIARLVGDRKFFSEQLVGYELGYRGLVRPRLFLDVAAFYNNYDHLQSVEPGAPYSESTPPPHLVIPYLFRNGLFGGTSGIEIAPDWRPSPWWRLRGSYSYLHIDLQKRATSSDTTSVSTTEGSSPHHEIYIQSFLNLPRNIEFDQTFGAVSALPAQHVGGYLTADLRLGWRPVRHFELSLVGQNLLQPHHTEFGGDPGPLVGIKRCGYGEVTLGW